jgi:putative lipoic acid-binding regulatory protein
MKYIKIKKVIKAQMSTLVEGSELIRGYALSDLAVDIVRQSAPEALVKVKKIKNIPAGNALGKYVHLNFESKEQYDAFSDAIDRGEISESNFPDVNYNVLDSGHVIEVSTDQIISEVSGFNLDNVLDFHFNVIANIAETIVHESVHGEQEERRETKRRQTSPEQNWIPENDYGAEAEAESAEVKIRNYMTSNKSKVYQDVLNKLSSSLSQEEISQYQDMINQVV